MPSSLRETPDAAFPRKGRGCRDAHCAPAAGSVPPKKAFPPQGGRWREAPDEGANVGVGRDDPARPPKPSPHRGEGGAKRRMRGQTYV